ncbi:MAG: Ycf51 family protein [Kastovskya adunca ATA6-11-RM4]|jgi:hypothetical protein|nr:Ycf51 family protein [Kastovskya adunca ATA6-11-RM4]
MDLQLPIDFITAGKWLGIVTIISAVLVVIAFLFKWGIRFRLVGVTGFLGVLTVGLFGLSLGLFSRTTIPGALRYAVVYDNGGPEVVIKVQPEITTTQLEATLQQAAADLYSLGRRGGVDNLLIIRARTVTHPEPGISQPLFLGQAKRSLAIREDEQMQVEVFPESFAQLPS